MYYGKNYGSMANKKRWCYTENYGTLIYEGKNHGRLQKNYKTLIDNGKNYGGSI